MKTNAERPSGLCMFPEYIRWAWLDPGCIPVPSIVCTWVFVQPMNQGEKKNISNSCIGRTQHLFCGIPGKNTYPESNHEETSDKLKLRDILKNKWPMHFKNVKVREDYERLGTVPVQGKWRDRKLMHGVRCQIGSWARKKVVSFSIKDIN